MQKGRTVFNIVKRLRHLLRGVAHARVRVVTTREIHVKNMYLILENRNEWDAGMRKLRGAHLLEGNIYQNCITSTVL